MRGVDSRGTRGEREWEWEWGVERGECFVLDKFDIFKERESCLEKSCS
jgi:hypothetical protein